MWKENKRKVFLCKNGSRKNGGDLFFLAAFNRNGVRKVNGNDVFFFFK